MRGKSFRARWRLANGACVRGCLAWHMCDCSAQHMSAAAPKYTSRALANGVREHGCSAWHMSDCSAGT